MNFLFSDNRTSNRYQSNLVDSGEKLPWLSDRGYLFGEGFFTTGIIKDGALSHYQYHLQRINESIKRLDFQSFDLVLFNHELCRKIKSIELGCVRITFTRQQINRGYAYSENSELNIAIQISDLSELTEGYCELSFAQTPISINPMFAGLKHLNRLDNIFAAKEITGHQQEKLLCHGDLVICGSRSNLFIKENDCWLTPKLDNAGVNGITRQRLLKVMDENAIKYRQCNISRQQVENCSSAFITNSLLGIWIVESVNSKLIQTQSSVMLKSKLAFGR